MDDNNKNEILNKEIDLIQSCINRMASNSFMCKGWLLSLIIAILALLPENISRFNICILILGVDLCFWWLDAFYLLQEKLYRFKYEWVINERMTSNKFFYDLNPYNKAMWRNVYEPYNRNFIIKYLRKLSRKITEWIIGTQENRPYIIEIMFTKTLLPMYGGCFMVILLLIMFKYK